MPAFIADHSLQARNDQQLKDEFFPVAPAATCE